MVCANTGGGVCRVLVEPESGKASNTGEQSVGGTGWARKMELIVCDFFVLFFALFPLLLSLCPIISRIDHIKAKPATTRWKGDVVFTPTNVTEHCVSVSVSSGAGASGLKVNE